MKKLLTVLALLTFCFGISGATDVMVNMSLQGWENAEDIFSVSSGDVTIIFDKGTNTSNVPKYYTTGFGARLYANNTMTITANNNTINSIVLTFSGTGYTGNLSANVGEYSVSGSTGTWSGSNKAVTFTAGVSHARIQRVVVTYLSGSTETYSVTCNSVANGSITANPTTAAANSIVTVTATPNDGYKLEEVTITPESGSVTAPTATINGNQAIFTMPASDVEVDATFAALPTYSIMVDGGTANPTTAYEGQTVTLIPNIPAGKVVDWSATTVTPSSVLITRNNYTFTMPAQDVYVSFAFKDAPSNHFVRITDVNQLEAGARYLLVYESTPAVLGAISSTNTKYGMSVTSSSDFIYRDGVIELTANTGARPFILGGQSGAWTFDVDGKYLYSATNGGLNTQVTNNNNGIWEISFTGNDVTIKNKGTTVRTIYYNKANPRFAGYTSTQASIQLYKEVSVSNDNLYLIGSQMNGKSGWNITSGPEFAYDSSTKKYSVDAYFDMADRGYFQLAEGLSDSNDNWDGLTGRYYASSNDSDVPVDNYFMDGTVGLNFTNSTSYSPGKYAFSIPAGMYTIVADKINWQVYVTQKPVTITISPGEGAFDSSMEVTLTSNLTDLGGTIYYTTDGSTPSASNGAVYNGAITLRATATVKAIAVLNHIQSNVIEQTYTKREQPFDPTKRKFAITGPAVGYWNPGAPVYFTNNGDGTYTWTGSVANSEFKLTGVSEDYEITDWGTFDAGVYGKQTVTLGNNVLQRGYQGNMIMPLEGKLTLTVSEVTESTCKLNIVQYVEPAKYYYSVVEEVKCMVISGDDNVAGEAEEGKTISLRVVPSGNTKFKKAVINKVTRNAGVKVEEEIEYTVSISETDDVTISFVMPAGEVEIHAFCDDIHAIQLEDGDDSNNYAILDKYSAIEGETVTVTTRTADYYKVNEIYYTYSIGEEVKRVEIAEVEGRNGVYSFVMPAADVTVNVTFRSIKHAVKFEAQSAGGTISVKANNEDISSMSEVLEYSMVEVTVTPNPGYVIEKFEVLEGIDVTGEEVDITKDNGIYTFFMPKTPVTINATFTLNVLPGDVNGDGEVNVSDVVAIANYTMGEMPEVFILEAADMNGDGDVNVTDVVNLANQVIGE